MATIKSDTDEMAFRELQILQDSIGGEYALNDGRLNTFLVFNGILLAVVGVLVSADSELLEGLLSKALLLCTILGLISSILSWISLSAGIRQIEKLKRGREASHPRLKNALDIGLLGADLGSPEHMSGTLAYRAYPLLLVTFWAFLLAIAVLQTG